MFHIRLHGDLIVTVRTLSGNISDEVWTELTDLVEAKAKEIKGVLAWAEGANAPSPGVKSMTA